MCATFSDDDVGKPVERADGKVIGTVDAIEGDRARVEPAPDALDSIMARFGWGDTIDPFVLEADAVDAVSDTRIHLTEEFSTGKTGTTAADERSESRQDNPQNRPDQ
ncbi:hypothetical protein HTZ84_20850 [Haloterrigena sp. SYSU A558-1]|uniref:PRC-barrel domain containing protein n=1 Tax=Haloterrigena gelatinilytica TaxID=2741724 RepID=A0A8J8GJD9_9EURY|nr:hypothetical protein [Haloterrigena gelatinilytica]NUB89452.1 hypothetical protein [Haloterrigena gelatinilytica]NUC74714.1 hypothetical protein [Haloterrigena gelatinilytica]